MTCLHWLGGLLIIIILGPAPLAAQGQMLDRGDVFEDVGETLDTTLCPIVPFELEFSITLPKLDAAVVDPRVKSGIFIDLGPSFIYQATNDFVELLRWNILDRR